MILRPLLVFLIVLNLGAAAWWCFHRPAAPPVERADNLPALQIAKDLGATSRPMASAGAAPAAVAARTCVFLGAFAAATEVQGALATLREIGVQANAVTRLRSPRGFNVLIPPLATPEAAAAEQNRLKDAGFTDQFLIREGAQANGIALGRFGTETAARSLLARLREAGFQAELSPVGAATSELWIQATATGAQDANALRRLSGAAQVKTGPCDE